ncbi:DUF3987 domain-containing protein [Chryseobacterium takakiae]|uniref:DUF3987 domain-containing protein n=1 Tax=Chryseobacterium takakiae TaxID=1302685 RepID=A0A1M4ZZ53_9FLAO|nr:DUF3987 domain-containing protein [Chryseobacterium takakiae]SHF23275.1 Protein of unknown function [Chryseobacterium takakiae]
MEEVKYNNGIVNEMLDDKVFKLLPSVLKNLTDNFEGRERDIVLVSSLSVLSVCLPNVYGVYDSDKVYPNLYSMIIAPAASGKGVMNKSRILIEKIHDRLLELSIHEQKECREEKKKAKERDFENCPSPEIKILPANISTAEMYSYLSKSQNGLVIIESEADTMSIMLNNDWSNYSDVLRKAFHHEPLSISRKLENIFVDIKEPKLSMLLSGTPQQLKSLIKSKENGLFSRFIVYSFDEISGFKSDLFLKKTNDINTIFQNEASVIFDFYGKLKELDYEIEFLFTESQNKAFTKEFEILHETIINGHSHSFLSNLRRHGLICYRIAMILSALRNLDRIIEDKKLLCENVDFILALRITKKLLKHSLITFNSFDDSFLSENDEQFLFSLPSTFTRAEAIQKGETLGIPTRTVDDKLSQWKKKKIIIPVKHGEYRRDRKMV